MYKSIKAVIAAGSIVCSAQIVCGQVFDTVIAKGGCLADSFIALPVEPEYEHDRGIRDVFFQDVHKEMAEKQLEKAISSNDEQLLAALLGRGVIANKSSDDLAYVLFDACSVSNNTIIRLLIDANIDINLQDQPSLYSPLMMMLAYERTDIMRDLVWHGAHARGVLSGRSDCIAPSHINVIFALMPKAEKIECLRMQKLRLMLERDWDVPTVINRLILQMSDTQWYACDELDITTLASK